MDIEKLLNEFALSSQILSEKHISIVFFDERPTIDNVFDAWKKYRHNSYVKDMYGESSDKNKSEVNNYEKYCELFDCLTLNDDFRDNKDKSDDPLWLCLLFENGDEIIIRRDQYSIDKKFTIMNCEFSKTPKHEPRNRLAKVRTEDGEFVIAIIHEPVKQ